ncbi:MAG: MATE family efflux transporter [Gammaproteobacteria bacterium]|nr:MATE family efflux transporter [Gammaproteobacteria bacterium]
MPPLWPREAAANLRLAAPLIAAQLAGVGMGTIDTVFAGRLGPQALAAVAAGINYNVLFFVFAMGVTMACSPIVAHAVGAGRPAGQSAAFVRRARRFALLLALAWTVLENLLAPAVLRHLGLAPATADVALAFVRRLSLSSFGFSLWFTQRFAAEGLGAAAPIMLAGLCGLAANGVLDWLLLFGHLGAPRLGAPGCGVATAVASLLMAGVLRLAFARVRRLHEVGGAAPIASGPGIGELLHIGLPNGAILLAETGLFVVTALTVGRFGDATLAAYQIAINFAALAFMIPLGIGLATAVRVGHACGGGDGVAARRAGWTGIGLGLINAGSNAALMVLGGGAIVALYTDDAAIAAAARHFLLLAAGFQFFDGVQVTANGALRGAKDTRMPMLITLAAYWCVGLPLGYGLAFAAGLRADGLWWGLTAGLGVAALGLSLRWRHGSRDRR